jgi:hypothetical protein
MSSVHGQHMQSVSNCSAANYTTVYKLHSTLQHSQHAITKHYLYVYLYIMYACTHMHCRYSLATACVNTHAAVLAAVSKRTLTPVPEALTSLNTSLALLGLKTPTTFTDGQ